MFFIPNGMKPVGNPAQNLPNLMERLPLQSDHQRLLVAYSDKLPSKRCRLGLPNLPPKILKLSNQLGDFLNALKQSLSTTTTTHKRHLTKPEVQCENMHQEFEFSNAGGILFDKRRMLQAAAIAARDLAKLAVAGHR
jgi:hypothetical protein